MLLNVLTVKDFSVIYLMIVKYETWSCIYIYINQYINEVHFPEFSRILAGLLT